MKNRIISWHVDKMNVRQAWLNGGSIKDSWLSKEVINMQICLHEQSTKVIPVYIMYPQHLHEDLISRNNVMLDWHLDRAIAQMIFMLLGQPEVDLVATSKFKLAYIFPLTEQVHSDLPMEAEGIMVPEAIQQPPRIPTSWTTVTDRA